MKRLPAPNQLTEPYDFQSSEERTVFWFIYDSLRSGRPVHQVQRAWRLLVAARRARAVPILLAVARAAAR